MFNVPKMTDITHQLITSHKWLTDGFITAAQVQTSPVEHTHTQPSKETSAEKTLSNERCQSAGDEALKSWYVVSVSENIRMMSLWTIIKDGLISLWIKGKKVCCEFYLVLTDDSLQLHSGFNPIHPGT